MLEDVDFALTPDEFRQSASGGPLEARSESSDASNLVDLDRQADAF